MLDKIDGTLAETYASKSGKEVEQVSAWMADETWFTAAEALEHGFATSIAESEAKAGAWNLSAYDKAPQAKAPEPMPEPEAESSISDDHRARQQQRLNMLSRI